MKYLIAIIALAAYTCFVVWADRKRERDSKKGKVIEMDLDETETFYHDN